MQNIIVHIPHASLETPKYFKERLIVDIKEFEKESIFESDYLIDEFKPKNHLTIMSKYSRMVCDVERFKNNEVMDKYGMGIIYEKDVYGKQFIRLDDNYKKKVLRYYDFHHRILNDIVKYNLDRYGTCILIDLHSFSDEYVYRLFNKKNCPDICIGYNQEDYDPVFVTWTMFHFIDYGYTVDINYPYSGAIVPSNYLGKKNTGITSLMIEINKRIYLKDGYELLDIPKAKKLKECMEKLYQHYECLLVEKKL